jgi:hypothetical protein
MARTGICGFLGVKLPDREADDAPPCAVHGVHGVVLKHMDTSVPVLGLSPAAA